MSMPFEEKVQTTLENFEYPYDNSSWGRLERRLIHNRLTQTNQASWVAGIAAAVVVILGSWGVYTTYFEVPQGMVALKSERFVGLETPIQRNLVALQANSEIIPTEPASATTPLHLSSAEYNHASADAKSSANSVGREILTAERHFITDKTSNLESVPSVPENLTRKSGTTDKNALLFVPSTDEACVGYSVDFGVTNGPKDGKYLWNFGDGSFSTEPTPRHEYGSPGTYDVSLSITKDGVIKSTTMDNMIRINPAPVSNFEWDFIVDGDETIPVKFINTSAYANESTWRFNPTEGSTEISPVEVFGENGKHTVELKVTNEFGCSDTKTKSVCINADELLATNFKFAPLKNGKTNLFMPKALADNNFRFRLMVFNGGEKIYETSNNHKGWDGRLPDGRIAPEGQTLKWVVVIENLITREDRLYTGNLTIIP